MKRLAFLVFLGGLLAAGCLRDTSYRCATDSACAGGTCQGNGFCSFVDATCASGQRFGDSAGDASNTCVGETGMDAGVDAARDDALPDAPRGCPASYAPRANGQGNHVYRIVVAQDAWETQRATCAAEGAYLAIPDDATELAAISGLFNQTSSYWIGISDAATEGTFVTVQGAAATFLPWAVGQPNDTGNSDCVEVNRFAGTFNDTRCGDGQRAVCECEP